MEGLSATETVQLSLPFRSSQNPTPTDGIGFKFLIDTRDENGLFFGMFF